MAKIILQDIDNVSYPFKEKHVEYLFEQGLITEELMNKFLETKMPYLIDYFLMEQKNGNCIKEHVELLNDKYKEKIEKTKKIILERNASIYEKDDFIELESLLFSTFEDFRKSTHYKTGRIQEIIDMNKELKKRHPELIIIGITARGIHAKKEPELYKEITSTTQEWNLKNEVGLKEIFFEKKKIRAYEEIINKYKNHEVICFIEDDPKNIEDFLKKGINCVLIRFEHHEQEKLVERLKKEYPEKLIIAETHKDVQKIINEILKK
ncbi:hypothetical protein KO361_02935 [Candidatus Woesearchaeota archaeon]|nr:hypothetical protein [Candidatus Woesearchaeota archaeon]